MHRVTNMENWEKKRGKVSFEVSFEQIPRARGMGTFHVVRSAEWFDAWGCESQQVLAKCLSGTREQVHGLGSAVLGEDLLSPPGSRWTRGLAPLVAAPCCDQSVLWEDFCLFPTRQQPHGRWETLPPHTNLCSEG